MSVKVVDLTAPRRELQVRLDPSPVYDFLACLYLIHTFEPDRGFEVASAWVARARRALGRELRAELAAFFPRLGPTMGMVGLLEHTPGAGVRAFIRQVAGAPAEELLELMLAEALADRGAVPLLHAAIGGPSPAVEAFLAAARPELDREALRRLVTLPRAEVKARLTRLLREGYARVYAPEEARVLPLLARDVETLQGRSGALAPAELVEQATGGFVISPDAPLAGVVLAPTYFFRPYNIITAYHGVRVFIYAIENSGDRPVPPEMVRLYKALGDETRLRILRLLAGREMYLQEVAKALGVTHVTALHHMAVLRAAHLVRVVERENLKYYQLRPDRAREAAGQWLAFVGAGAGGGA